MSLDIDTQVRNALELRRGDWPEVAKAAGVSHSWISQFCRGIIPNPGILTLRRLREALGLAGPQETPVADSGHGKLPESV